MASIIEIWSLPTCSPKYMTRNLMGFLELLLILASSNAHPLLWAKCFGDHMRFFNLRKCGSVRDCLQFIIHPSLTLIILVWLAGRLDRQEDHLKRMYGLTNYDVVLREKKRPKLSMDLHPILKFRYTDVGTMVPISNLLFTRWFASLIFWTPETLHPFFLVIVSNCK